MTSKSDFVIENNKLIKYQGDIDAEVIIVPEEVEWIEEYALSNLNAKEIYLPSKLRGIGYKALANNKNLTTISVGEILGYLITNWIDNCPSLSHLIGDNYKDRTYDNGIIYSRYYGHKQIEWCPHTLEGKVIIPEDIEIIGENAFAQCDKITELVLSNRIKYIYEKNFNGLTALKEITFGKNIKHISPKAFKQLKSLERINICDNNAFYKIRNEALYERQTNTMLALPQTITGTYIIPEKTQHFSQYAFVSSKVTKIIIPSSVVMRNAPDGLFMHCNKLEAIEFEDPNATVELRYFTKIKKYKNPNLKVLRRVVPSIKPNQLSTKLKQLLIDDVIENLTKPKTDDKEWFNQWLDYLKRTKKTHYKQMVDSPLLLKLMLDHKLLTLSDIRELIEIVKDKNDVEINSLLLDYQNTNFSQDALMKQKEKELFKDPYSVSNMKKIWSFKKEEDNSITILSYKGTEAHVVVPNEIGGKTVKRIKEDCFSPYAPRLNDEQIKYRREQLLSVVIPDSVECVGNKLFNDCIALLSVTFPPYMTIKSIKEPNNSYWYEGMFNNCKNLTEITIPEGVTSLEPNFFKNCNKLQRVNLPQSLTSISYYSFFQCEMLEEIEIPSSVEKISSNCFVNCKSLSKVIMHEGLREIDTYAFSECNSLTELCIPESATSLWHPIFTTTDKNHVVTIKAKEGSAAIAYAKAYNLNYEIIEHDNK